MEKDKPSVTEAWATPVSTPPQTTSLSPLSPQQTLDWQDQLTELQTHHKQESLQQQKEHLQQLQSFREQLLLELSTQVSTGPSTGNLSSTLTTSNVLKSPTSLLVAHGEPPLIITSASPQPPESEAQDHHHDDTLTSVSLSQSLEFLQLPPVTTPLIRTSTVESLSADHSKDCIPLVGALTSEVNETDPTQTSGFDSFPPNTGQDWRNAHTPERVAVFTPSKQLSPPDSPARNDRELSPKTPSKEQPFYLQHSPVGLTTQQQQHRGAVFTPSPKGSEAGFKAVLVEKHNKHIRDLKGYYEMEIHELEKQLEVYRVHSAEQMKENTSISFSSPPPKRLDDPSAQGMDKRTVQDENADLKVKYLQLQAQLGESQREIRELERDLTRSEEHMVESHGRCESLEKSVSVLQDRLEASRTQLKQQDKVAGQLHSDLQDTAEELHFWKDQRSQDVEKMEQLLYEFEVIQKEKRDLQESVSLFEQELRQCAVDIQSLENAVGKYRAMETQYKSTIGQLEDEIRRLQLINNRLNSQSTHYQLGSYRSPQANRGTEEKHSPATRISRTPPPRHSQPASRASDPHTPILSPSARRSEGGEGHLTRKKWLEPSDPHTPSPSTRTSHHSEGGEGHLTRKKWLEPSDSRTPSPSARTSHHSEGGEGHLTRKKWLEPSDPHTPSPSARTSHHSEGGEGHLTRKKWLEPSDPGLIIGETSSPALSPQPDDSRMLMMQYHSPNGSPSKTKRIITHRSPILEATAAKRGLTISQNRPELQRQMDEGAPVNYEKKSDPEAVLDSALHAVRQGSLVASDKGGPYKSHRKNKAGTKKTKTGVKDDSMTIEEKVQQYMRVVEQSEQKLATLQAEKKQLQSALQRAPKSEGRVTARTKQAQYDMEQHLDEVDKEISSLKMVLRSHHALRK